MLKPRMKKKIDLKLKLHGKKRYPTKSVKYLGIKIHERFTWNEHINDTGIKLNWANAMLYKVRGICEFQGSKSTYHAIFDCHLNYANKIWSQNKNSEIEMLNENLFSKGMK